MNVALAYDATLEMAPGSDARAPGAAITRALCGHWDHSPPCPLAPHHTNAERDGDRVRLRLVLVTAPESADRVARLVREALAEGRLEVDPPAGEQAEAAVWRLDTLEPTVLTAEEQDLAARLAVDWSEGL